ncbi:MAG: ABC transporter ATP-binding protein [Mycoplasmataceae bacterium]|nr:ABC transporter ATP-binding protein [Mycoplasmataceae bacterium]
MTKIEKVKKETSKIATKKERLLIMDVKNITKNYGKVEVLKGINFKVCSGEKIAIVGSNGAGKSTLSEIIAKVKEPTKGNIKYFFEKDGKESHGKGNISSNIGIQFQDSSYPDFYKVSDLVKFVIGAAGVKITDEELEELYKTFELSKLKNEVAKRLSGGQQQRLNILLAIVNNPQLLILDEVGTGLDVESRTKIKSYIKSYASEHDATLLLISHNSDEVLELVDRVIVIHNGLIFNDQPLSDIIKKWKSFDDYMNNLYLNVFKKDLDLRVTKSDKFKIRKNK